MSAAKQMTQQSYARLAAWMFLAYIVTGIAAMMVFQTVEGANGVAAKLAMAAAHPGRVRLAVLLSFITAIEALILSAALFAITRKSEEVLALLAFSLRAGEAILNTVAVIATLGFLRLAMGQQASIAAGMNVDVLASLSLRIREWGFVLAAMYFSAGSLIFAYLFLRAKTIPTSLSWLGVISSLLLIVSLPVQLVGLITGGIAMLPWLPMLVFELGLAAWLLLKGIHSPDRD